MKLKKHYEKENFQLNFIIMVRKKEPFEKTENGNVQVISCDSVGGYLQSKFFNFQTPMVFVHEVCIKLRWQFEYFSREYERAYNQRI